MAVAALVEGGDVRRAHVRHEALDGRLRHLAIGDQVAVDQMEELGLDLQVGVGQWNARSPDAAQAQRVVGDGGLGLVKALVQLVEHRRAVEVCFRRRVDGDVGFLVAAHGVVEYRQVILDGGGSRPIVCVAELLDALVDVEIRPPQALGHQVAAQGRQLSGLGEVVGLLVNAGDAVVDEEVDVCLEDAQVREGLLGVRVVDHIVPDVQAVGELVPLFDVLAEGEVFGAVGLQGMHEAALDGAESHGDIGRGHDMLGGLAGVLVGEGVDDLVRKLVLDRVGDGVDEVE